MSNLPTGTVTFLFTDIEGSTPLWEQYPAAMATALARHHVLLRSAIEAQAGYVFNVAGDAVCAAFATASDALAAALAAQRALSAASWEPTPIRVRMGLHTGNAVATAGDYRSGPTLNRVARVMSTAQGGQILLSQTTAGLVRGQLPLGVTLRDVGEQRLKGLADPERLWQVVAAGLRSDFPPLKTLSGTQHNLPPQLTSFVGRDKEIAELEQLLATTRLLTLTGAGGTGKTRLALEAASGVLDRYPDGVWFIELAPLADPEFVPQAVAAALKVSEQPGRSLLSTLGETLRGKQVLLLLDNCEHLVDACARLTDALLHGAPGIRIMATSREPLNIRGETTYHVPSLDVPAADTSTGAGQAAQPSALMQYAATRLFVERASAAKTGFALTAANAPAVAQICRRLDGMPLAIELAAARIRVLGAEQIAARLDDRFRLLTGGSRTALHRQQTLRATIDWSHSLLTEPERVLPRRLSVFAGGWTLEAAEAVTKDESRLARDERGGKMKDDANHFQPSTFRLQPSDILDLLTRLVEKSLVIEEESNGQTRYHMLETIRQYAQEKLFESGEGNQTRDQHLAYFGQLSMQVGAASKGPQIALALDRADIELENLRLALDWSSTSGALDAGLQIVTNLFIFWFARGHQNEGTAALQKFLELPALAAETELGGLALAQFGHFLYRRGEYAQAQQPLQKALVIGQKIESAAVVGVATFNLGALAEIQDDFETAVRLMQQTLPLFEQTQDYHFLGTALANLGSLAQRKGDLPQALDYYEQANKYLASIGDFSQQAFALRHWSLALLDNGDAPSAMRRAQESLTANITAGDKQGIAACLAAVGAILLRSGRITQTVRLFAAADRLLEVIHTRLIPLDNRRYTLELALAREQVSLEDFERAWNEGRALSLEQAIALAQAATPLEQPSQSLSQAPVNAVDDTGLTDRERDVLRLLARGLSNQHIAERLVVSPYTVRAHLRAIYGKLGVTTRSAATRYALEHHLV